MADKSKMAGKSEMARSRIESDAPLFAEVSATNKPLGI